MPKYICPVITCNINYEGSVWEIIPQAVTHGQGSHSMNLSDEDIAVIIEKQARHEAVEEFLPKEKVVLPEPKPIIGFHDKQKYDWWKR